MTKRLIHRSAFLCGLLAFTPSAYCSLIIHPVFESGFTNDPNAAVVEATINSAIDFYETNISTNLTISIGFDEFGGGLAASGSFSAIIPYSRFLALLNDVSSGDTTDTSALDLLPITSTNPADGGPNVLLRWANLKALGVATGPTPDKCGGSGGTDFAGCVLLNPNFTSPPNSAASGINLLWLAEHEIDEVLGIGSGLFCSGSGAANCSIFTPMPEDFFRYTAGGGRTYSLNPQTDLACTNAPPAFFSIDGTTNLAQFNNCDNGGDYGDWASVSASGSPAQVQDAFSSLGPTPALSRTSPEIIALDAIGYNLTTDAPEPAPIGLCGSALIAAACFGSRRRSPASVKEYLATGLASLESRTMRQVAELTPARWAANRR